MEKGTCILNNISINTRYFSSRFTVQNSNGSAPNKHPPHPSYVLDNVYLFVCLV